MEDEGDLAEEAGGVLRDNLQQGAVGAGVGIEFKAGGDFDFYGALPGGLAAAGEQLVDLKFGGGDALGEDFVDVLGEAVFFFGVEFEGAEGVSELEAVDDDAGFIGEGVGFDDVHAPGGEGAGDVGEEAAAVAGDDGEFDELAVGAELELDGVLIEFGGKQKVVADLLRQAGLQVALGQSLQEFADGGLLDFVLVGVAGLAVGGDHAADAVEQGGVKGDAVADFVDAAVHEVGGGHVELPEVFRFPGSEGVGVDGFDIRIGHEGEHLEQLRRADLFAQGVDVVLIEDVAAEGVGHFEVAADELADGFALFDVEVEAGEEAVG